MSERAEFMERPQVKSAMEELAGSCFERLRSTDAEPQFPDPAQFLRDRDVDVPDGLSLELGHSVHEEGEGIAEWYDCGDGVKSRPQCEMVRGRWHCFWVCP